MDANLTLARWQGSVDRTLSDHDADLADHSIQISGLDRRLSGLDVVVGKMAVKIGVAAAIGGLLGGGLVTLVAYLALGVLQHHP